MTYNSQHVYQTKEIVRQVVLLKLLLSGIGASYNFTAPAEPQLWAHTALPSTESPLASA